MDQVATVPPSHASSTSTHAPVRSASPLDDAPKPTGDRGVVVLAYAVTIFAQRVFAVPGAAADQQVHFAVVWRQPGRVDRGDAVLSGRVVRRLPVCPPDEHLSEAAGPVHRASGAAGIRSRARDCHANLADRGDETDGGRAVAAVADSDGAGGQRGRALFCTVDHGAAVAKVV